MLHGAQRILCFLVLGMLCPAIAAAQDPPSWVLQQQTQLAEGQSHPGVEVLALTDDDLRAIEAIGLDSPQGSSLLQVFVGQGTQPTWGRVLLQDRRLVFQPRFALSSHVTCRVIFHGNRVRPGVPEPSSQTLVWQPDSQHPHESAVPPQLLGVSPGHDRLPQNVLRMYLSFSQPMAQGTAYRFLRFRKADGSEIEQPFLSIPQELWSRDGRRLTLLFDPGRIKQGLARHELLGPPFEIGQQYVLSVSREWCSADSVGGMPLPQDYRFEFSIDDPDTQQPAVSNWQLAAPLAGTSDPLSVTFGEPLDLGMLQHSLQVVDIEKQLLLSGQTHVTADGLRWQFQPDEPWRPGGYVLEANPRLEDRAGNSLAQPFERDLSDATNSPTGEVETRPTTLRFQVAYPRPDRPNVVVILADDLGWRDLSCEGSEFYESPHIDRICHEGMRFRQGYAACQVCSPSRAAIMTGKSPARLKITDYIGAPSGSDWKRNTQLWPAFYQRSLPLPEITLAEAFREAGYKTFFAGKWHLGGQGSLPQDHGFEVNIGGHLAGTPPGGFFSPYKNPQMVDGPPGESLPLRLGQETADFIENHQHQPFLAFLAFYSVHAPIQTTQALWSRYRAKAESLPAVEHRFLIDRTMPVRQVQDHPLYAGMVASMDQGVGLVLDRLDRLGLSHHTIVVFTSDNGGVSSGDGYATSNLPLRGGKGRQWEGGLREPFYIRWPAEISAESCNDTPVIGTDLYPTLLDLCGLPPRPEQTLDGISLRPLLYGQSIAERPLIWHYPHYGNQGGEPASIIRQGNWKLIRYLEDQRLELYDLASDAGEQQNVAAQQPRVLDDLQHRLDRYLTEVAAEQPQPNPGFDPVAYEQWQTSIRDQQLPKRESDHARFLRPDFQPAQGWWK